MKTRDDVIAEMMRWSEDFIEQSSPIFGGLPICPFAKAARIKQSIRFEVHCFAEVDPFELDGQVMTLIGASRREHSMTRATGSSWERTPWGAVETTAWTISKKSESEG
jgi:hypothetical protein